jgi:hypothetical protein
MPDVVPKENVAAVIVVAAETFGAVMVNVAARLTNGFCGPFPAIEPLAFE